MPLPIDPSFLTGGAEWQIQAPTATPGQQQGGSNFGGALTQAIQGLSDQQTEAAGAAQSLAGGTASDPSSVVMAVERARLSMQLASQIRTKAVEAEQDIFHTQV
ncbi:MAG TPA: flagellar hook-basal body complex protein FliE [Thermoleophilaceae bacterium]|jgi:flagellar hook-basal body complex protein FliE|nr:flagellar hook-basal body complex protein FliE [Thermoleophilaceae bacterium]